MTKEKNFFRNLHIANVLFNNTNKIKITKAISEGGTFNNLQEAVIINTFLSKTKKIDPIEIILGMKTMQRFFMFKSNNYFWYQNFNFEPSPVLEVFGCDQDELTAHILKHDKGSLKVLDIQKNQNHYNRNFNRINLQALTEVSCSNLEIFSLYFEGVTFESEEIQRWVTRLPKLKEVRSNDASFLGYNYFGKTKVYYSGISFSFFPFFFFFFDKNNS